MNRKGESELSASIRYSLPDADGTRLYPLDCEPRLTLLLACFFVNILSQWQEKHLVLTQLLSGLILSPQTQATPKREHEATHRVEYDLLIVSSSYRDHLNTATV